MYFILGLFSWYSSYKSIDVTLVLEWSSSSAMGTTINTGVFVTMPFSAPHSECICMVEPVETGRMLVFIDLGDDVSCDLLKGKIYVWVFFVFWVSEQKAERCAQQWAPAPVSSDWVQTAYHLTAWISAWVSDIQHPANLHLCLKPFNLGPIVFERLHDRMWSRRWFRSACHQHCHMRGVLAWKLVRP